MQRQMLAGLAAQVMTQLELRRSLMLLETEMESQTLYVDRLEREQQELVLQSTTDALTGLANRRAFQRRLDIEFARARTMGGTLALMILDVDYFKPYNDSFGHPAGDALLKQLADTIRDGCRTQDFPARVGGEEFAVILPGTTRESAFVIAERLRRSVQRAVWPNRPVTVSIGVALADVANETVHMLTEHADRSLYHSKRSGRNRVTLMDHSVA
jgi:diguanylate cyclase (GGDEF)-like protein